MKKITTGIIGTLAVAMLTLAAHAVTIATNITLTNSHPVDDGLEGTSSGVYRIPALAKATNGVVVAAFDCRHRSTGDFGCGVQTECIDTAGCISLDNGVTWSDPSLFIDVINATNAATGEPEYPVSKLTSIGDPCIVYDPGKNRFLLMGITGGGLHQSHDSTGTNCIADCVLYTRGAGESDSWQEWTGGPVGNRRSCKQMILDSLASVDDSATNDENELNCILQGPGHGIVQRTTVYAEDGETVLMPEGAIVFPMQYFGTKTPYNNKPSGWANDSYAFAVYSTDGGGTWKSTKLATVRGAQENSVMELDDGSWVMMAKCVSGGVRYFFRTTDFENWTQYDSMSPSEVCQGSCLKLGEGADGKGRYVACFSAESYRAKITLHFGTDSSGDSNSLGISWGRAYDLVVQDQTYGTYGYNSLAMLDETTLGVLLEVAGTMILKTVDVSDILANNELDAVRPLAVWDGDFSEEALCAYDDCGLVDWNETHADDYSSVTIDRENQGLLFDATNAMAGLTVLVRYSGLADDESLTNVLFASCVNSSHQYDRVGIMLRPDGKLCGLANNYTSSNSDYVYTGTAAGGSIPESGVMAFTYSTAGAYLYYGETLAEIASSAVWGSSGLKYSADTAIYGAGIGGMCRDASKAGLQAAKGMVVEAVAVFPYVLTVDEMNAYEWPGDSIAKIEVSEATSVSAINAMLDGYESGVVTIADGTVIAVDEAFSSVPVKIRSEGSITLSASSQPDISYFAVVDFSGVKGAVKRSWLAPTVVNYNFNSSIGAVTTPAIVQKGKWTHSNYAASGSDTNVFADCISTFSWSSATLWSSGSGTIMNGYLDDGANNGSGVEISLSCVPYDTYDVIIYCHTDSGSQFRAKTVNGVAYTWDDESGATVEGDSAWGTVTTDVVAYGTNALRVANLTGPLTISGGARSGSIRGCISAVQIIPHLSVKADGVAFSISNADAEYNNANLTVSDATITVPCGGMEDLTAGASIRLNSLDFGYLAPLSATQTNAAAIAITADGVKYTSALAVLDTDDTFTGVDGTTVSRLVYSFEDVECILKAEESYSIEFLDAAGNAMSSVRYKVAKDVNAAFDGVLFQSGHSNYVPLSGLTGEIVFSDEFFSWTPGESPTGWFTWWNGNATASPKTLVGPDGTATNIYTTVSGSWTPYRSDASSLSDFTFCTYGCADMVKADEGKYAVLWCMGQSGSQRTALVKDEYGNICLVSITGANVAPTNIINAGPVKGYHLFTVRFSTTGGASLQIDDGDVYSDASFTSQTTATGFQVGAVRSGTVAPLDEGIDFAVLRMFAFETSEIPTTQYSSLCAKYPAVETFGGLETDLGDSATLYMPSLASTGKVSVQSGTLVVPSGVTASMTAFSLGDKQNSPVFGLNLAGRIDITTTSSFETNDAWKTYADMKYYNRGVVFGEWEGSGTLDITGTFYAPNTVVTLCHDSTATELNIDGGLFMVKGVTVNHANRATLNLKGGGILCLGEFPSYSNAIVKNYGYGIVMGMASWTDTDAITLNGAGSGTTFSADGIALTFAGAVTGSGNATIYAPKGGSVEFADFGATGSVAVSEGTLRIAAATEFARDLTLSSSATLDIVIDESEIADGATLLTASSLTMEDGAVVTLNGASVEDYDIEFANGALTLTAKDAPLTVVVDGDGIAISNTNCVFDAGSFTGISGVTLTIPSSLADGLATEGCITLKSLDFGFLSDYNASDTHARYIAITVGDTTYASSLVTTNTTDVFTDANGTTYPRLVYSFEGSACVIPVDTACAVKFLDADGKEMSKVRYRPGTGVASVLDGISYSGYYTGLTYVPVVQVNGVIGEEENVTTMVVEVDGACVRISNTNSAPDQATWDVADTSAVTLSIPPGLADGLTQGAVIKLSSIDFGYISDDYQGATHARRLRLSWGGETWTSECVSTNASDAFPAKDGGTAYRLEYAFSDCYITVGETYSLSLLDASGAALKKMRYILVSDADSVISGLDLTSNGTTYTPMFQLNGEIVDDAPCAKIFDCTPGDSPKGWVSSWDGNYGGSVQSVIGPEGLATNMYAASSDDSWCPYKKVPTPSVLSNYTFCVHGNADAVSASDGKYAVLWCMGWNADERTALVKDSAGNIRLVHANSSSTITGNIDVGAVEGWHLFTVRFDCDAGASLQIDDGELSSDADFKSVSSEGFQVGSVLGGSHSPFVRGAGFFVAKMFAYGTSEIPDEQYAGLCEEYPAVANSVVAEINGVEYYRLRYAIDALGLAGTFSVANGTVVDVEAQTISSPVTGEEFSFAELGLTVAAGDVDGVYSVEYTMADGCVLRISEIMPKPTDDQDPGERCGMDPNGLESGWVELENTSDAWADLGDYSFLRSNRGKKTGQADYGNFPSVMVAPHSRFVFYTSERYANTSSAEDSAFATFDETAPKLYGDDLNNVLVWPAKVNPKKSPFVRLIYTPDSTIVDTVVIPSDVPEGYSIVVGETVSGEATKRWLCPTPTRGAENTDTASLTRIGPNAGPLYEISSQKKHDSASEFARPAIPAIPGEDYEITFSFNPVMSPTTAASFRDEDAITNIILVYRTDITNKVCSVPVDTSTGTFDKKDWGYTYKVKIPADDLPARGHLIQWKFQATDACANTWTSPSFNNPDDGYEWYGTIVEPDPETQMSENLPTWHMFVDEASKAQMDLQADAQTLANNARVGIYDSSTSNYYDYVRIDLRGHTSAEFTKKGHGLRFAKAHPLTMVDSVTGETIEEIRKTSLISEYADPSYMRQMVAFWLFRKMGNDVPFDFPVRCNLNGEFYQLAFNSERFTDELIEDVYGLDKYGYSYKNAGTLKSGSGTSAGSIKKKTPDDEDESNITVLQNELRAYLYSCGAQNVSGTTTSALSAETTDTTGLDNAELTKFVVEKFDLPRWLNYLASARITHEMDDVWANLCVYYDNAEMKEGVRGTDTWRPLGYDFNISFGQYYQDAGYIGGLVSSQDWFKSHPFYGGNRVRCWNSSAMTGSPINNGNDGFEAVYQSEKFRRLYLRRLRTLMDQELKTPGTAEADVPFMAQMRRMADLMRTDAALDTAAWPNDSSDDVIDSWRKETRPADMDAGIDDIWENYVVPRQTHLYVTHSVTNTAWEVGYGSNLNAGIPEAQSDILVLAPNIAITNLTALDEETAASLGVDSLFYDGDVVVIYNGNDEAVDMSGWTLAQSVSFTFPAGTVCDANDCIYIVRDRREYIAAHDDELTDEVIVGNAAFSVNGAIALYDAEGTLVFGKGPETDEHKYLRLNSFCGNTATGDGDEGEWFTLTNISDSATLDLTGVTVCFLKQGDDETATHCHFTFDDGAIDPLDAFTANQTDYASAGWSKIQNNKQGITIWDKYGSVCQYLEVTQKNFALAYGLGGWLVCDSTDAEVTKKSQWHQEYALSNDGEDDGAEFTAASQEAADAIVASASVTLTDEDVEAGLDAMYLTIVAEAVEGASDTYKAVVAVNPDTVAAPTVATDSAATPVAVEENEDGTTAVSVTIGNAVKGLWYGCEVADALGDGSAFTNDVPSFQRATDEATTITGSARTESSGFFRVKALPAKPAE